MRRASSACSRFFVLRDFISRHACFHVAYATRVDGFSADTLDYALLFTLRRAHESSCRYAYFYAARRCAFTLLDVECLSACRAPITPIND